MWYHPNQPAKTSTTEVKQHLKKQFEMPSSIRLKQIKADERKWNVWETPWTTRPSQGALKTTAQWENSLSSLGSLLEWRQKNKFNTSSSKSSPMAKHPPCRAPWSPTQGAAPEHQCYPTSLRWDHGALEHWAQSGCEDTVQLPCGYRDSQSVSRNKIQSWNAAQVITMVDTLAWWLLPDWAWVQNKQE